MNLNSSSRPLVSILLHSALCLQLHDSISPFEAHSSMSNCHPIFICQFSKTPLKVLSNTKVYKLEESSTIPMKILANFDPHAPKQSEVSSLKAKPNLRVQITNLHRYQNYWFYRESREIFWLTTPVPSPMGLGIRIFPEKWSHQKKNEGMHGNKNTRGLHLLYYEYYLMNIFWSNLMFIHTIFCA